ncbi:CbtB domain-containing protein [Qaidamihabitans albus]|uniref:CbtB domain-containing protein n=1 Tax=Qaidamihabitans albus TaxID=2795733 RepID=UPI0018F19C3D|nr:CbtB-domain containing protein [Qaidamihabitans albus]
MSQATATVPHPVQVSIPLREIVPWAIFVGILSLIVLFFVSTEAGAVELFAGNGLVHEFVHDGRHLLAFPCH